LPVVEPVLQALIKGTLDVFKEAMTKTSNKTDSSITVLLVTTSFPTKHNPVSGIFIKRLVDNIPLSVNVSVLTPCACVPEAFIKHKRYQFLCFRYGPWQWQKLAHMPGGIPAALEQHISMKLLLPIFLLSMLVRCIREIPRVDVVHANWSVNGFICAMANILARRPLILTLRGTDISKSESSKVYDLLLRFAMRFSHVITVVSEAMRQRLVTKYPASSHKIIFVPNGVDNQLLEIPLKQLDSKQEVYHVLVVANLIKLKNLPVIVKAASLLSDQLKIKLTIVGEGPEKAALQKLSQQLNLEKDVRFAGLVNPDDIAEYYKHTDVLVLASLSEGKPNVVLEAFAAGVPVIASNIDGVREMIGENENGLMFDPNDEHALMACMLDLFRNANLYRKFSENGRNYILQNKLSWMDSGERFAAIYKDLVEAG